jgi:hypothetical protein
MSNILGYLKINLSRFKEKIKEKNIIKSNSKSKSNSNSKVIFKDNNDNDNDNYNYNNNYFYRENIDNKKIIIEEIKRVLLLTKKISINDYFLTELFLTLKINISEILEEILLIFKKEKYREIKAIIYLIYSNIFYLNDDIITVKKILNKIKFNKIKIK